MEGRHYADDIILGALKEDMPNGDITTDNVIKAGTRAKAVLIARQEAVIAGIEVFERVFMLLDRTTSFIRLTEDGNHVSDGTILTEMEGEAAVLLKGERTALNLLQHMSGIATKTAAFCRRVSDLPVRITDTRKTIPGMRRLEKYAVRVGGGYNHRFNLSDGVLIKDNHIKAAGSIQKAVELVRAGIPHTARIEVETENLKQVEEALNARVDIIMFDNMSIRMMAEAVELVNRRVLTEASGDINIETVRDVALTGVDIISSGELTHSVEAANISMKFV